MDIDDEIEAISIAIADIESAISELKNCSCFEDIVSSWENDLKDLNDRLEELEAIQNAEWQKEMTWQNREYERSVI